MTILVIAGIPKGILIYGILIVFPPFPRSLIDETVLGTHTDGAFWLTVYLRAFLHGLVSVDDTTRVPPTKTHSDLRYHSFASYFKLLGLNTMGR